MSLYLLIYYRYFASWHISLYLSIIVSTRLFVHRRSTCFAFINPRKLLYEISGDLSHNELSAHLSISEILQEGHKSRLQPTTTPCGFFMIFRQWSWVEFIMNTYARWSIPTSCVPVKETLWSRSLAKLALV